MAARHFCWKPGKNGRVGVKGPEGSIKEHYLSYLRAVKACSLNAPLALIKEYALRCRHRDGSQPQASSLHHAANTGCERLHSEEDLLPNENTSPAWKHELTWCKFRHNVTGSRWSGSDHNYTDLKVFSSETFYSIKPGKKGDDTIIHQDLASFK